MAVRVTERHGFTLSFASSRIRHNGCAFCHGNEARIFFSLALAFNRFVSTEEIEAHQLHFSDDVALDKRHKIMKVHVCRLRRKLYDINSRLVIDTQRQAGAGGQPRGYCLYRLRELPR